MNIGGKDRPVKFGLNQTIEYCKLRGISITQMNDDSLRMQSGSGDGSEIRDLIWSALKDGARFGKVDFEATAYDVGDWLEDLKDGAMEQFMKDFAESMSPIIENNEPVKKKATTK